MRRYTRYVHFWAFVLVGVIVGCTDNAVEPDKDWDRSDWSMGIWYFDSVSDDGRVLLRWQTGRTGWVPYPPDWGPPPEPPPIIRRVAVLVSDLSADNGFATVAVHDHDGPDSVWVERLSNDAPYYFRLAPFDESLHQLGQSAPLMTTCGPQPLDAQIVETGLPWMSIYSPAWSPDGLHLAYVRPTHVDDNGYEQNIMVFDVMGGARRQLTQYVGAEHYLGHPAWSPDGAYLAYEYSATRTAGDIDYRIWRTPVDHFVATSITQGRVDSNPSWALDGSIIFCRGTMGPPNIPEVFEASPTLWTSQQLTLDQELRKYHPSASPSSGEIVFTAVGLNSLTSHLYSIDAGGGTPRRFIGGSYWQEDYPSWAFDGRRMIFSSNRSGHTEIWSYNVATETYVQLTRGMEDRPERKAGALSPDGTLLAYWEEPRYSSYASLKILRLEAR